MENYVVNATKFL